VKARRRGTAAIAGAVAGLVSVALLPATPLAALGSFGTPVAIPGANVGEPGINVAPDGSIYVNGPAGLLSHLPGSASPVFKSTNSGATWTTTNPGLRANLPGGGDSNIAIDPVNGTLYMTDLWLVNSTVSRSTDGAATWLANPLQGVIVQDRPWIATAGGGDVYHLTHQIPLGLIVSKSVTPLDGLVFPLHTVAATVLDQTGCVCPSGNLIAQAGGLLGDKVGVIYSTSTGGVKFAFSTNGGLTFKNAVVSSVTGAATNTNFPVVANAGGGHLVAAWQEVIGNSSRVQFNSSSNWGASWGSPQTLVSSGTSVYPWVAAAGGHVVVSLYHSSETATPDTVSPAAQWFESFAESVDGGATFSALAAVDPTPAKTGPVCTGGTNCTANRELGDFQTVTLDNAGHALVSYARVTAGVIQTMFDREL